MTGAWRFTTINCVRVWRFYAHVGPAEIVRSIAPACIRAAALAIPLALPGAAFVPAAPVPHGGVVYGGLAYAPYAAGGSLLSPDFPAWAPWKQASLGEPQPSAATGAATGWSPRAGSLISTTPVTPMLPGDIPHWLPDRGVPGQSVPPTEVPEPSAWMVLVVAVVAALACKHLTAKAKS